MNPEKFKILYSIDGFITEFWRKASTSNTYEEAYEKLEREYIELFGERRYASYDSFRVIRDRKAKGNKRPKL
jgi:hypothetical protein